MHFSSTISANSTSVKHPGALKRYGSIDAPDKRLYEGMSGSLLFPECVKYQNLIGLLKRPKSCYPSYRITSIFFAASSRSSVEKRRQRTNMKADSLMLQQHIPHRGPRDLWANEETMRSWVVWLHSIDEVPEIYWDFFASLSLEPDEEFPYTVLMPSYEGSLIRSRPKLVCLVEPDIYVVELRRRMLEVTRFPCADVNYIEAGTILLKSWVKISGVTQDGLSTSSFRCNTVTQNFLDPFVDRVRAVTPPFASTDFESEQAKFSYLLDVHFKFMNYARRSILPGEQVIASLVQQEIRSKVLGTFYRNITPAHISILTDRELILIAEDKERFTRYGVPYGGIWYYIPLQRITAVSLARRDEHTLTFSIQMPQDDRLNLVFGAANRTEVEELVSQTNEMISRVGTQEYQ